MIKIPEEHYEFFLFGIKRGGNHGVINWILEHFESYAYYNNCFCIDGFLFVNQKDEIKKKGKPPYEIHIISFEDKPIELEKKYSSNIKLISKLKSKKNILILRDAYNTYASRYMKKLNPSPNMIWWNDLWTNYNDPNIWIEYAKEYLGITNLLENKILINYNKWFSDPLYREQLSNLFKKTHTDKGLQRILDNGGGSSFDGKKYDNKAQKMEVLTRWKKFIKNENYIEKIISNEELKHLSKKIFDHQINLKTFL